MVQNADKVQKLYNHWLGGGDEVNDERSRKVAPMAKVVLWHFQGSHFCEKARWALDFKRIPHVRRVLGVSYLVRARWKAGKATLPVLLLDGRAIGDSTRIIGTLEAYRAEPPLYPSNRQDCERALLLRISSTKSSDIRCALQPSYSLC